jgi:hypothetical protein
VDERLLDVEFSEPASVGNIINDGDALANALKRIVELERELERRDMAAAAARERIDEILQKR